MPSKGILQTDLQLADNQQKYTGKVRDTYTIEDKIVMVATDRISAFDVVSKQPIPYKGQVINQIAADQLERTSDIIDNWVTSTPDPNVTVGVKASVIPVEVIVRGYLAGSAWRAYEGGSRNICGVALADDLHKNERFPVPIITPTTKAVEGHDEETSAEQMVESGVVTADEWSRIETIAHQLFDRGSDDARKQNLILVDTKYEFGRLENGDIILVDEIHTPDSSRYWLSADYNQKYMDGTDQEQLSKEFVREWLLEQGFDGSTGEWPTMPDDFVDKVSQRYIELYEKLLGKEFDKASYDDVEQRITDNLKGVI